MEISIQNLYDLIEAVRLLHPYKVYGDFDTVTSYNEGWDDALDALLGRMEYIFNGLAEDIRARYETEMAGLMDIAYKSKDL